MNPCKETGYSDEITCECRYVAATDDMDREDCPCHADVDGKPYPGGATCCPSFDFYGTHDATCGNAPLEAESDLEWAVRRAPQPVESIPWTIPALETLRRAPGIATIGNGLFVKTGRRA